MIDQKKMGDFIASRRRALGLTQQSLADRLNVTDKAVSKWERGLSYPDITILSPLAEALGVSEGELLNGDTASESGEELPAPRDFVALSYLGTATRERRAKVARVLLAVYTVTLVLGSFVSVLCDLLINHAVTWSLIVVASCVMGWAVVIPFFRATRYKIFFSCLSLTVLIVPFLAAIEYACPIKGWLLNPALPIVGLSLALLWIPVLLHTFTRTSIWYIFALLCLLSLPFNVLVNYFAGSPQEYWETFVNILFTLPMALVLVVTGWFLRRRQRA